jgi:TRAP-type C4-dicarboxylate transport system permease large subunit
LTNEPLEKVAAAAVPFFVLILLMVAAITIFPEIVTWLPSKMVQ